MDQHDIGLDARQRLEPGMHRLLARRSALSWRRVIEGADGFIEDRNIIGVHYRLHGRDIGMLAERLHGAEDNGPAAHHAVLLWSARAGAKSAPGGDEDGCGALSSGHASSKTCRANRFCWMSRASASRPHSPYHAGPARE